MAVIIKKKKYFAPDEPVVTPIEAIPIDDKQQAIEALRQQVFDLGLVVNRLNEKKPPVDVVATIQRDKEGRMESIFIKSNEL